MLSNFNHPRHRAQHKPLSFTPQKSTDCPTQTAWCKGKWQYKKKPNDNQPEHVLQLKLIVGYVICNWIRTNNTLFAGARTTVPRSLARSFCWPHTRTYTHTRVGTRIHLSSVGWFGGFFSCKRARGSGEKKGFCNKIMVRFWLAPCVCLCAFHHVHEDIFCHPAINVLLRFAKCGAVKWYDFCFVFTS